jgi:signal transduction histidine kinase
MSATLARVLGPWTTRIEAKSAAHGLAYPWWIPEVSTLGQLGCVVAALAQRDALWPPDWVALTLLIVGAGPTLQFVLRAVWIPWWLEGCLVLLASGWLLSDQPFPDVPADLAPALLMLFVAEVTASAGLRPGLLMGLAAVALMGGFALDDALPGFTISALGTLLALVVGYMLLWQTRALTAERHGRGEERARATVAERERIAREIHDLVAHSLSVTLLHLTGARHALRDGDVPDAMEALDDAERIGRRAMADIRRTVTGLGGLDGDASPTRPLPAAADIAGLVAQFAAAGLAVRYDASGDLGRLPASAGLGLYRITQEALANVARHAPSSRAEVRLAIGPAEARLLVRNEPGGRPRAAGAGEGGGSGVPGMTARATGLGGTIRVGPHDDAWLVEVLLPLAADAGCLLGRSTS